MPSAPDTLQSTLSIGTRLTGVFITNAKHHEQRNPRNSRGNTQPRIPATIEDLETLKRELMKAEVRLAKARATVVSTEIDIKVINTRLRSFTK